MITGNLAKVHYRVKVRKHLNVDKKIIWEIIIVLIVKNNDSVYRNNVFQTFCF